MDIDIKELMNAATEALASGKFKGDVVGVKYVENEIGNVEAGGIGVQKVYHGANGQNIEDGQQSSSCHALSVNQERDEEKFHFVHPELDEEQGWRIHDAVKRMVAYGKVADICRYLEELSKKGQVLLPQSPSVAYQELVRLGMPNGEGYSEKYFSGQYKNK